LFERDDAGEPSLDHAIAEHIAGFGRFAHQRDERGLAAAME
jgi:hypothetical protein